MKWQLICCLFSKVDEKTLQKVASHAILLYKKLYKIEQFGKKRSIGEQ